MEREQLLYYAVKNGGEFGAISKDVESNAPWEKIDYKGNYITVLDGIYPNKLRALKHAPWVLFYEGDLSFLKDASCGVIGSRICTDYSIKACIDIATFLSENKIVVVSGLAKGMDTVAHNYAIKYKTIAVIGCGVDICYPKENMSLYNEIKKNHLLLSEYPNGVKPESFHFPQRNRIVAALSDKMVVVEARIKSGTMITVRETQKLRKEIFCIPHSLGSITGGGCNELIKNGATCLVDLAELIQ
ncbi:MAG: DNA-processing protein DprA [Erysipelotrichaceae bacterium]